jgi:hypothetical protein
MTSTEFTSKQKTSAQSVFKDKINYYPQNGNSKISYKDPSRFIQPLNNFIFASDFSNKNFPVRERLNSFNSFNNEKEEDLFGKSFIYRHNSNIFPSLFDHQFRTHSRVQSQFQSKSNTRIENKKNIKFEQDNLLSRLVENENDQEKEDPKSGILFGNKFDKKVNFARNHIISKDNIIIKDNNNFNFDEPCKIDKNTNLNLSTLKDNNFGTKFFTNHNYGYKCSCSKTQCNRKYCECYNSGNYCIDCNCKNCQNQPPVNTYSNKRPSEVVSKMKKSKEICTCTKSGCNKNYCECFKSGNKCTAMCRCIDCENTEDNSIKVKNKITNINYECCKANSIYIIKNILVIENVNNSHKEQKNINYLFENLENKKDKMTNKKRKRDESKNSEEIKGKNQTNKEEDEQEQEQFLFNNSLFDKNGKVILRHINMIHY